MAKLILLTLALATPGQAYSFAFFFTRNVFALHAMTHL